MHSTQDSLLLEQITSHKKTHIINTAPPSFYKSIWNHPSRSKYHACKTSAVHVQPVLSILLSTFAGFGVAMSGSSILVEFLRWRRRQRAATNQNQTSSQVVLNQTRWPQMNQPETPPYTGPQLHQTEAENPETFSGR
ncbi:RING-CH-type domain-containing protein [Forsythia ovata]|uniref:RING-CH-type domain-containing protein n=1 Tax=Forsythia ovata TaxID=205694 RepID=A0ABD1RKV5_9LAMI